MEGNAAVWMTREEIAAKLGVVPNSIRGKVQKGQLERKVVDGKNLYRIVGEVTLPKVSERDLPPSPTPTKAESLIERVKPRTPEVFNPKQALLDQLASLKIERSIDAIEKGDEIDLATGEISRELEARMSMRQQKQVKEIQDALDRIKHGEYGFCEDCGEPIPIQRLRLFPAARLCVRCQEEADQMEKMREEHNMRGGPWREETTETTFGKTFEE
jgi:DnaK suppressor protein